MTPLRALLVGLVILTPLVVRAQTQENSAVYVSQLDQDLTLRRVGVLPVTDNLEGIYSRPVEAQLLDLVRKSHRWDLVETPNAPALPSVIEMEEKPNEMQKALSNLDGDAFIVAALSRGPSGLSIRLDLFAKKDGKLLAQEVLKDHPRFELNEVRDRVGDMYRKIVSKLPYEGLILSRQQNRVTVNLGASDGLKKDQIITAIQIISVNRHPRFNFILGAEKEILGRIKILKVDQTLSFGAIVSEKEKGAIQKFSKIASLDPVTYSAPTGIGEDGEIGDLGVRADSNTTFGKNPREWLPIRPPSFGLVTMKLGFGSYASNVNLGSAGTFETNSMLVPSIGVGGELWLTPEWIVRADLLQSMLSSANPRAGSSPANLNQNRSRYSLELGYNFLMRDDFFGPKAVLSLGFALNRMYADTSDPLAITTTNYSGMILGLGGSVPVSDDNLWFLGGRMNLYVLTSLREEPVTSGTSPNNTLSEFSLSVEHKLAVNLRALAVLDFSLFSSTFGGTGSRLGPGGVSESATSLSQRQTTLSGGLTYMF